MKIFLWFIRSFVIGSWELSHTTPPLLLLLLIFFSFSAPPLSSLFLSLSLSLSLVSFRHGSPALKKEENPSQAKTSSSLSSSKWLVRTPSYGSTYWSTSSHISWMVFYWVYSVSLISAEHYTATQCWTLFQRSTEASHLIHGTLRFNWMKSALQIKCIIIIIIIIIMSLKSTGDLYCKHAEANAHDH